MQYKMFYLAKRNPSIVPEDWPRTWKSHAIYASQFAAIGEVVGSVSYCSRVLQPMLDGALFDPPGASRDYDGVAVIANPSPDAFRSILDDPSLDPIAANDGLSPEERAKIDADERRVFSTNVPKFAFRARETLAHGGAAGRGAVIRLLARKAGASREDFAAYLGERHADIAIRAGDATGVVTRYVQNVLREAPPPGYPFDGVTESWFADADDATRSFVDEAFRPVSDDLTAFCDMARSVTMLTYVTHRWPRD